MPGPASTDKLACAQVSETESDWLVGMSDRQPYDNARCESFLKTLKQEEIDTRQYSDRSDLEFGQMQHLRDRFSVTTLRCGKGFAPLVEGSLPQSTR